MGKVTLSGHVGGDSYDRVERGVSAFITETTENGFQFSVCRLPADRAFDEA
jgi:hypothetical protein